MALLNENAFTKTNNFFFDTVMNKISPSEWMVLSALIRFLKGWNKKSDYISNRRIQKIINISENTIRKCLIKLESYKIIKIEMKKVGCFLYTFIEINYNYNEYQFSKNTKITDRVKNFFNGKSKKESVKFEKKDEKTTSNFDALYSKIEDGKTQISMSSRTSILEDIKDIKKQNIKTYIQKESENKVQELPILKLKTFENSKKNVCYDFKNLNNDLEEKDLFLENETDIENELIEEKKSIKKEVHNLKNDIEDILINFGINKNYFKSNSDILGLDKNTIMDSIEKVNFLHSEGKCKSKAGYLLSILTKECETKKANIYENIKKAETKINNEISSELKNKFVNFFYSKRLIQSPNIQNAFSFCVHELLRSKNNDINFLKDLKKIISKEDIKTIFDFAVKDCNVFKVRYEKNLETFLSKYEIIESFNDDKAFNIKENMDNLIKSLINPIKNKISNLNDNFFENDNEIIPC